MTSIRSLINQIHFSLNELGAQNHHHDFEDICRHVARIRIGINILPATGPVSSGGDQGRDFEAHHTLLGPQDNNTHPYISTPSTFACTIQKEDIPSKVKSDVKEIATKGSRIATIYYFSLHNIAVSKRHKLQQWARDQYKIDLELFDGQYLSEQLADRDLFWIALEYLHVPSSLYPSTENIDYLKSKEKWENYTFEFPNFAILDEVRSLARHCLFDKKTMPDLAFWLDILKKLLELESTIEYKRKVLYEIVALRIRGMGSLEGWEDFVHQYFNLSNSFSYPLEAQDACVVATYAYGSMVRGVSKFKEEELSNYRNRIELYIDKELNNRNSKSVKAVLLELKGYEILTNPSSQSVEEGLKCWLELCNLLKDTPLFPLEHFSDQLNKLSAYVGDEPTYEKIINKINPLLAKRIGKFAVADACRNRALVYKEQGNIPKFLKELHRAKIDWFAHETFYGSLLSVLLIADAYQEIGLTYASKYYGFAAAYLANRSRNDREKRLMPQALSLVAENCYINGEWSHFLQYTELGLVSMRVYAQDLDSPLSESIYKKSIFYTALVFTFSKILDKAKLFTLVDRKIREWRLDLMEGTIVAAQKKWDNEPSANIIKTLQKGFRNVPFCDVGYKRSVSFEAFGILWSFDWKNGLTEDAKAEQLISMIQILFGECIDTDLYLIKGNVKIQIHLGKSYILTNESTKDVFSWSIELPDDPLSSQDSIEKSHLLFFKAVVEIISELSLLPNKKIYTILDDKFKHGLMNTLFIGNSYEVLFREFTPPELYEDILTLQPIQYLKQADFKLSTSEYFKWKDSILSEYSKERSEELIRKRYQNSITAIVVTLEKLKKQPNFVSTVKKLRLEGWKDWHILIAINSIVVNYRMNIESYDKPEHLLKKFREVSNEPETINSKDVPLAEFSEEALKMQLLFIIPAMLKGMGLEFKQRILTDSIIEFVDKRYNYFMDDVPHENYFDF